MFTILNDTGSLPESARSTVFLALAATPNSVVNEMRPYLIHGSPCSGMHTRTRLPA